MLIQIRLRSIAKIIDSQWRPEHSKKSMIVKLQGFLARTLTQTTQPPRFGEHRIKIYTRPYRDFFTKTLPLFLYLMLLLPLSFSSLLLEQKDLLVK